MFRGRESRHNAKINFVFVALKRMSAVKALLAARRLPMENHANPFMGLVVETMWGCCKCDSRGIGGTGTMPRPS